MDHVGILLWVIIVIGAILIFISNDWHNGGTI